MPQSPHRLLGPPGSSSAVSRTKAQRDASDQAWEDALQRSHDLEAFRDRDTTPQEIAQLADKWGVARSTVFRNLNRFREGGDLSALLPRRPGKAPGSSPFDPEIESVVREAAKRLWAISENATVEDIFGEIAKECRARQLMRPSRATVGRRLLKLRSEWTSFKGEARQSLKEGRRLVKSSYTISEPLAVVQIDHTLADVLLVEPQTQSVIGRPTLTLAIDVATRCVMGFCASLEAPSSHLVALCLETAVFPKGRAQEQNADGDWPMYGLMKSIHTDNGREFHSRAFRRGCDLNGIATIYRPPATPRFGGHIERLIGTFMRRTRLLPGNTYSDMLGRRPRHAESKASLSLTDFRSFIEEEIQRYHSRNHRTLGSTPRNAWERAWKRSRGVETPRLPANRERFLMDFLPVRNRVVTREGIEIDGLRFSHECLQGEINPRVQRIVRIDPRDISRVYLECLDGQCLTVPLRADHAMHRMSWWEWRAVRKQRKSTKRQVVDVEYAASKTLEPLPSKLRLARQTVRQAEWRALQEIQALPVPDTKLSPLLSSDEDSALPEWEILD